MEADVSVLVVMSPNSVTTDLDNEIVSWENIGKEKTEAGKETVGQVLPLPLVYSGSPGRAAARLLPACVGKNVHRN